MLLQFALCALLPAPQADQLDVSAAARFEPSAPQYFEVTDTARSVAGKDYVAELDVDRFDFVPRVRTASGRSPKVQFRLRSVEIDGMPVDAAAKSGARLDGDALAVPRGSVVERYEVSLDSVEQTFVFDEPTDGPLAVTVDVFTELDIVQRGGETMFLDGHQGARMSAAFAVDAAGHSLPLETRFEGSSYRIEVPASFTRTATFPVTIDPILSTVLVDDWVLDLRNPIVAYDSASDLFVAVYEEIDNGISSIYCRTMSRSGALVDEAYVWASTSSSHSSPGVASGGANGKVLIAAVREDLTGGNDAMVSRLATVQGLALAPEVRLDTSATSGPYSQCIVGGSQFGLYHVAWTNQVSTANHDIVSRLVLADGTLPSGQEIAIATGPDDTTHPSVPKCNGPWDPTHATWPVAYQINDGGGQFDRVGVTELNPGGSIRHTTYELLLPGVEPLISSPLAGPGPRTNLIVYQNRNQSNRRIVHSFVTDGVPTNHGSLGGAALPGWGNNDEETIHALDSNGERFCLVWTDGGPAAPRTFFSTFGTLNGFLSGSEHYPLLSTDPTTVTDIAAMGPGGDYVSVQEFLPAGGTYNIGATIYDDAGDPVGGGMCQAAGLNSTGYPGYLRMHGSAVAGGTLTLVATDLPPNSFGFFLVSMTPAPPVNPVGSQGYLCLGGSIGRFQAQAQSSGPEGWFSLDVDTSNLPLNPFQPAIAGQFYAFQAWYRDANPNATSNFTSAMTYIAQ